MRAIILAAGRGLRLQQPDTDQLPKCLLRFDGLTLLERHLRLLRNVGINDVTLALGWRHELVEAELERIRWQPRPEIVRTAWKRAEALGAKGGEVGCRCLLIRINEERIIPAKRPGNGEVDGNRALFERSMHQREVSLGHLPFGELRSQGAMRKRRNPSITI